MYGFTVLVSFRLGLRLGLRGVISLSCMPAHPRCVHKVHATYKLHSYLVPVSHPIVQHFRQEPTRVRCPMSPEVQSVREPWVHYPLSPGGPHQCHSSAGAARQDTAHLLNVLPKCGKQGGWRNTTAEHPYTAMLAISPTDSVCTGVRATPSRFVRFQQGVHRRSTCYQYRHCRCAQGGVHPAPTTSLPRRRRQGPPCRMQVQGR